jgi:putative metallohydrolase (TIGR04338 family)
MRRQWTLTMRPGMGTSTPEGVWETPCGGCGGTVCLRERQDNVAGRRLLYAMCAQCDKVYALLDDLGPVRRARDSTRSRLYRAEGRAFERNGEARGGLERYETIEECQEYVDYLVKRYGDTLRICRAAAGSRAVVVVTDGRGARAATARRVAGQRYRINLPRWARKQWVILHEFAHCLVNGRRPHVASHGPEFCAAYVALVRAEVGHWASIGLEDELEAEGLWADFNAGPCGCKQCNMSDAVAHALA